MKAYRLPAPQQAPEFQEVPQPVAGPGEILLEVGGCGLCHTDLGLMQRPAEQYRGIRIPFTLGHEVSGRIVALGEGVIGFRVGEGVAVVPLWGSCGHCSPCRRGEENFCLALTQMTGAGLGFDGGLARYMKVEARFAVPLGDLDPVQAAPLTDAGLTTYTALKPALPQLGPGSSAVVIGVGGLGQLAVQFLRCLTPSVIIAVDSNPEHREVAAQFGADHVLASDEHTADTIRELTHGAGANFVLDCVGAQTTLRSGVAALAPLGRLTLVGAALETIPFGLHEIPWGAQLTTSLGGGTANLREVVELARTGKVQTLEDRYSLDQAAQAYDDLRHGRLRGRAVCIP